MVNNRKVVITGVGPVTPIGIGVREFWQSVSAGVSGTRALRNTPYGKTIIPFRSRVVAQIDDPRIASHSGEDRVATLARHATIAACMDAKMAPAEQKKLGVYVGTAVGSTAELEQYFIDSEQSLEGNASAHHASALLFHTTADILAAMLETDGPVMTISTGCTAGLDAVGIAADAIRVGEIDSAIAVGTDAPICPVVLAAFDVIGALSCRNDDPTRASRPFDRDRDGFVLGEGAAALCIEEREHAIARGARIYCEIDGYSSVNNRYHMSDLPDDGLALAECICIALEDAKVSPKDVAHVNAHGSSTPQNDICETNAIKRALDKHAFAITVNSLKAMTGHALGASNTIEIAACALSLYHRWHFPTMHLDNPSKGCDLDYLPYRGRRTVQGHILKLSNGFSGIHSAIVLGGAA